MKTRHYGINMGALSILLDTNHWPRGKKVNRNFVCCKANSSKQILLHYLESKLIPATLGAICRDWVEPVSTAWDGILCVEESDKKLKLLLKQIFSKFLITYNVFVNYVLFTKTTMDFCRIRKISMQTIKKLSYHRYFWPLGHLA